MSVDVLQAAAGTGSCMRWLALEHPTESAAHVCWGKPCSVPSTDINVENSKCRHKKAQAPQASLWQFACDLPT